MAFAERKRNRLAGYDYSQPGAYFVTVCTEDRKPVLGTVVGADALISPHTAPVVGADALIGPYVRLSPIGQTVEKYTRTIPGIDSYVIMPNHVHMILRISAKNSIDGPMWAFAPTDTSVEKLVRSWKILITKELGRSVWQRSYHDHIIRNEREYTEYTRYIMENPVKWCVDRYYPGY